jgi:hypothetical protein
MMKWCCFILLICSPFQGICQHTYDTLVNHLIVKVESSCYLFSYFPYAGGELEIPLGKNHALFLNGGPIIGLAQPKPVNGQTALDRTGFVLNPGFKKYIFRSKPNNNQMFVSVDFCYRESRFRSAETFNMNDAQKTYQDTILIQHKAVGFTLNIGQMLYFGNFGFEFSAGIGMLFMRHTYDEQLLPENKFSNDALPRFWLKEQFWTPRIPVRTRLFYRF